MSSQEKIGGRVFAFGIIPATECIAVQMTVASVIGEPLFKAIMTSQGASTDKAKSVDISSLAVGLMIMKMSDLGPEALLKTMEIVFRYVTVDGQRINIDTHFTGRPKELWQVFIAALKVNFSSFMDGLNFDLPHAQA